MSSLEPLLAASSTFTEEFLVEVLMDLKNEQRFFFSMKRPTDLITFVKLMEKLLFF